MRTQSSIAVSADGAAWLLFNVSVDLPRQLAQAPELWPKTLRENPFVAVLLTDANVDHTAGLGELRQDPGPLVIISSRMTKDLLAGERTYERFGRSPHLWTTDTGKCPIESFEIEMLDVPGLLPGYAGRKPAPGAVVAYIVRERRTRAQITLAPIFSEIDERLRAAIAASDIAFLDGTFYSNDELLDCGLLPKDARSLGHAPVGGSDGTLAQVAALPGRRVFVHLNNSNPMLDPASDAYEAVTSAGCEIADDGSVYHAPRV
jgi:pyrroloquinoline quinone biosynthesis protein B